MSDLNSNDLHELTVAITNLANAITFSTYQHIQYTELKASTLQAVVDWAKANAATLTVGGGAVLAWYRHRILNFMAGLKKPGYTAPAANPPAIAPTSPANTPQSLQDGVKPTTTMPSVPPIAGQPIQPSPPAGG